MGETELQVLPELMRRPLVALQTLCKYDLSYMVISTLNVRLFSPLFIFYFTYFLRRTDCAK